MNRIENPVGFADRLSQGNAAGQESIDLARAHSVRPADVSPTTSIFPPEGRHSRIPRVFLPGFLVVPLLLVACGQTSSSPLETPTLVPTIVRPETPAPTATIEIQRLIADANWMTSWLEKYPWNPKTQEGAIDAHLGVNLWGKFQNLNRDTKTMLVVVDGKVVLIEVEAETHFQARPKDVDLKRPIAEQIRPIDPQQLKPGDIVEILYKRGQDGKPELTSISRLDG